MTKLKPIPDDTSDDNILLPLIVAKEFKFPLACIQTENGVVYAVQDWLRGLLGNEDVRYVLSNIRRSHPELDSLIKMLPYRSTDNKVYQRPYTNEDGLFYLLVHARLSRGRSRLADARNFIANFSAEYEYLKCSPVRGKIITEYEFQSMLVAALQAIVCGDGINEYYSTPSGRVVDIAIGSADHTTLVSAVTAAGLVETLKGAGPFTIFAPTNAAEPSWINFPLRSPCAPLPENSLKSLIADTGFW